MLRLIEVPNVARDDKMVAHLREEATTREYAVYGLTEDHRWYQRYINVRWPRFFFTKAYATAMQSKDPSTKVGAVIVDPDHTELVSGYNNPPRGFDDTDPDLSRRPAKYHFFCHAEENCVSNAARKGIKLEGGILYITWIPCAACARMMVNAGIKEVRVHYEGHLAMETLTKGDQRWDESHGAALKILSQCGVLVTFWSGPLLPIRPMFCGVEQDW